MPYGRIGDEMHSNRKVMHLLSLPNGLAALGLWTLANSWCNDELTDGHVPLYVLTRLGGTEKLAGLLVTVGLWHVEEGGFLFHDWEDFNETRTDVLAKRAKDAEKKGNQRASRRASKALSRNVSPGDTPEDSAEKQLGSPGAPYPSPELTPLPPTGASGPSASGAHGQTVRDAWAAAYFAASAGTPPTLAGQQFAAAVDFARRVARTHGRTLAEAAQAIAAATLATGKREDRVWGLSRIDPFAAPELAEPKTPPLARVEHDW